MPKRVDLTGRRYGRLVVLEIGEYTISTTRTKERLWKCLCDCGKITSVYAHCLNKKNGKSTKSCGCLQKESTLARWKGCGELSLSFFNHYKNLAKYRKKEFTVNIEYLWNLYLKQNKKCSITGLSIFIDRKYGMNRYENNINTASLDRIDSDKGYIEGNVQWVHKKINIMKNNMTSQEFLDWCKLVVNPIKEDKID